MARSRPSICSCVLLILATGLCAHQANAEALSGPFDWVVSLLKSIFSGNRNMLLERDVESFDAHIRVKAKPTSAPVDSSASTLGRKAEFGEDGKQGILAAKMQPVLEPAASGGGENTEVHERFLRGMYGGYGDYGYSPMYTGYGGYGNYGEPLMEAMVDSHTATYGYGDMDYGYGGYGMYGKETPMSMAEMPMEMDASYGSYGTYGEHTEPMYGIEELSTYGEYGSYGTGDSTEPMYGHDSGMYSTDINMYMADMPMEMPDMPAKMDGSYGTYGENTEPMYGDYGVEEMSAYGGEYGSYGTDEEPMYGSYSGMYDKEMPMFMADMPTEMEGSYGTYGEPTAPMYGDYGVEEMSAYGGEYGYGMYGMY